ncbi:MAG: DnaD domain protein [Lachnospiraceae bacterium]|nr:DnaD domain protein [Lachnospiraceae bacterium]
METITVTTKNHETYSSISNFFIDYYMTEADGEFVKIYLYLVRLLNSGRAITVAEIADHFHLTQEDICQAIRYWIKQGILRLEYTTDKILTGITMLPLTPKAPNRENASLLSLLEEDMDTNVATPESKAAPKRKSRTTAAVKTAVDQPETAATEIRDSAAVPKKVAYKAAFIEEKKNDEDFGNLLYQTETYFAKPLTQSDINALLYIYEELRFSPDLMEYLVEHCVSIGKKSCRYIEAVALDWYKNGITSVKEAKAAAQNYNTIYLSVLKQLGIQRRVPTPAETSYIDTWYNTFAFDKNIIMEACRRAVTSNPHSANLHYVNGILENWHRQNVKSLSDIEVLDQKWESEKKKKAVSGKASSVSQFNQYQSSTDSNVLSEFEELFLQETNN